MLAVYVSVNISWLLVWHYFVWRSIALPLWQALRDILPYAFIAAGAMLITYYITVDIASIYLRLLAKMLIAALLYISTLWLCGSVLLKESLQYILRRKEGEE